jgi:Subtilase family/IPT/TIG domain
MSHRAVSSIARRRIPAGRLLLAVPLVLLACTPHALFSPASALASGGRAALTRPALKTTGVEHPRWACPHGFCDAIVVAGANGASASGVDAGSGERKGLDPKDLQSAYAIPSSLESPQTIALVDAYGYPDAESDLSTYRERYGLPPCTKANGCFEKVNQSGKQGDYPEEEEGWDLEAALDEDMVSAACPQCHILMVEGNGELPAELGAAVDTAAKLGATEISNSYGYPEALEEVCAKNDCSSYEKDYEHAGVVIFASAGDEGYADTYRELGFLTTNFPASSPNVVAVGGTALLKDRSSPRGWLEEVWNEPAIGGGTGSGCTTKSKPSWQTDKGCKGRTDNDIAAVAAVVSPVSIRYDGTWTLVGGTSVASPLVAGIEAHASARAHALGAHAFYEEPGSLNDITEGFNWDPDNESGTSECAPEEYLCNAEPGYDGPTGLGTPNGVPNLYEAPVVKSISPRNGPLAGATKVKITGTALLGASAVDFGSTAAKEFTVTSSTSITAVSPAGSAPGSVPVTVTTKGGRSAESRSDVFTYDKGRAG